MNRPYTAQSPYSLTPTERIHSAVEDDYPIDESLEDYEDYEAYGYDQDYEPIDRRWVWVAGVAGVILLVAVVCTIVILGGGDSGSVSSTVTRSLTPQTSQPVTTARTPAATTPSAPSPTPLTPETVTTVTPTPSAPPTAATPSAAVAAPAPALAPNAITYRVTGNRNLVDLVTVIYTDAQGALQTDVNVALPWTKTVVLDPGVTLSSVTATSMMGQLDCSITDAGGAVIAAQNTNTMITNCTR